MHLSFTLFLESNKTLCTKYYLKTNCKFRSCMSREWPLLQHISINNAVFILNIYCDIFFVILMNIFARWQKDRQNRLYTQK